MQGITSQFVAVVAVLPEMGSPLACPLGMIDRSGAYWMMPKSLPSYRFQPVWTW